MAQATARDAKARRHVFDFKIWQLRHDLTSAQPAREQLEDIGHAYAHASHTRATAALLGIDGDGVHQLNGVAHVDRLNAMRRAIRARSGRARDGGLFSSILGPNRRAM